MSCTAKADDPAAVLKAERLNFLGKELPQDSAAAWRSRKRAALPNKIL